MKSIPEPCLCGALDCPRCFPATWNQHLCFICDGQVEEALSKQGSELCQECIDAQDPEHQNGEASYNTAEYRGEA